jgi:hypothetical protein
MGAIEDRIQMHIPIAYNALVNASEFGPPTMKLAVDTVKYQLFGTIVEQSLEASAYDGIRLDFAGKIAAVKIIPAAADFWSDQYTNFTRHGVDETGTFPDRIAHLWRVHERLLREIEDDAVQFEDILDVKKYRKLRKPIVSTTGDLITPDPNTFPRQYPDETSALPWSKWGH